MGRALPPLLDRAILFAHRGARAKEREHSIETVSVALRLGATGIHVDAWTTSDGVVLLDRSGLVRRFPKRWISDVNHSAVADRFATLDDILTVAIDVPIRVAAPDDATASAVLAIARTVWKWTRVPTTTTR